MAAAAAATTTVLVCGYRDDPAKHWAHAYMDAALPAGPRVVYTADVLDSTSGRHFARNVLSQPFCDEHYSKYNAVFVLDLDWVPASTDAAAGLVVVMMGLLARDGQLHLGRLGALDVPALVEMLAVAGLAVSMASSGDTLVVRETAPEPRQCMRCAKQDKLSACARCLRAWYCGADCQNKHWKAHKMMCARRVGAPAHMLTDEAGPPPKGTLASFPMKTAQPLALCEAGAGGMLSAIGWQGLPVPLFVVDAKSGSLAPRNCFFNCAYIARTAPQRTWRIRGCWQVSVCQFGGRYACGTELVGHAVLQQSCGAIRDPTVDADPSTTFLFDDRFDDVLALLLEMPQDELRSLMPHVIANVAVVANPRNNAVSAQMTTLMCDAVLMASADGARKDLSEDQAVVRPSTAPPALLSMTCRCRRTKRDVTERAHLQMYSCGAACVS
jgi:hypothetical protein